LGLRGTLFFFRCTGGYFWECGGLSIGRGIRFTDFDGYEGNLRMHWDLGRKGFKLVLEIFH